MRKIGVQSGGIFSGDVEAGYKALHDAGFDCVDYNIDVNLPWAKITSGEFNPYFERSTEEIIEEHKAHKAAAEKYGISFSQMHAPFQLYVYNNDEINEKCYDVVDKCLAVAKFLDCPYVIVHPINIALEHGLEEEKRVNLEYFRRIAPMAKKHGVMVCLENMFSCITRHTVEAVCSDFAQAADYIDTLNAEAGEELFGFCFDVGHANLLGKSMPCSLELLGKRLKTLHIHENNGVQDLHAIPYTYSCFFSYSPESLTDWKGFFKGLHDIGYKGALSFETCGSLKIFPKELHPQVLSLIAATGRYFSEQIDACEAQ